MTISTALAGQLQEHVDEHRHVEPPPTSRARSNSSVLENVRLNAPALLGITIALDPVAQRPRVDPQVTRDLGDRPAGLLDQTDRALPELPVELSTCL